MSSDRQRRIPLDPPHPPAGSCPFPSLQPGKCPDCRQVTWRIGADAEDLEPWLGFDQVVRMRPHQCPAPNPGQAR